MLPTKGVALGYIYVPSQAEVTENSSHTHTARVLFVYDSFYLIFKILLVTLYSSVG